MFLVDWIMALAVVIFMIFFFNRLVGWLISYALKYYLWRFHKVHFEVQSLQLSLLGGRLFFKNITYIGTNEAICAVQGSLTWRYWLIHYRRAGIFNNLLPKNDTFPARLCLKVNGLEWLVFNRTAAYDALFEYLNNNSDSSSLGPDEKQFFNKPETSDDVSSRSTNNTTTNNLSNTNTRTTESDGVSFTAINPAETTTTPSTHKGAHWIASILPLEIQCFKAAMILGNRRTPHHLVCHMRSGTIMADIQKPASPQDLYRMAIDLNMVKPVIELRTNIDYNRPEMAGFHSLTPFSVLKRFKHRNESATRSLEFLRWFSLKKKNKSSTTSKNMPTPGDTTTNTDKPAWRGLSRYQVFGETDDFASSVVITNNIDIEEEYAKYSVLLDAPSGSILYYYDQPGRIPNPGSGLRDSEPEWGTHMQFRDATIHYGPWTDRQRIPLQQLLFPQYSIDTKLPDVSMMQPGQPRISTEFNLLVEFNGDTIIRIPIREFSKDAAYLEQRRSDPVGSATRPFGWIEAKVRHGSTLSFASQLVPSMRGWKNTFTFDMKQLELRSSVNHGLFFQAESHLLHGDLRAPNQWNGLNIWQLRNSSDSVKTFFLREHVTLISDMFADFNSGAPTPYDLFIPSRYEVHWAVTRYSIYLNVNDMNVINSPTDFDDNVFLSFQGRILDITVDVPLDQVQPMFSKTTFDIKTPQFDLIVDAPQWHTIRNFLPSKECGRAYQFDLKGSYSFYSEVDTSFTDRISIDVSAQHVTLLCYGFIIQYVMKIRENYFGENVHFRTLEEYLEDPNIKNPQYTHTRVSCLLLLFVPKQILTRVTTTWTSYCIYMSRTDVWLCRVTFTAVAPTFV